MQFDVYRKNLFIISFYKDTHTHARTQNNNNKKRKNKRNIRNSL
jgi:hypothetical protein